MVKTATLTGYSKCIQRLIDAGYNENNANNIIHQLSFICFSNYIDNHSERIKYINETIDKLSNNEIIQEQIEAEYNKFIQEHWKREAEKKEIEETERQERHRHYEAGRQKRLLDALQIIGILELKLDENQLDEWLQHSNTYIEHGKIHYDDIITFADYIQQREAKLILKTEQEKRRQQAEAEQKEIQAEYNKAEKRRKELSSKGQFEIDGLLIQCRKNKTNFLLPNENDKKITAYKIIERLSKDAFKAYKKQTTFKDNKIQTLPYSERLRLIFYFRQQYRNTSILENSKDIIEFIYTALKHTNNIELNSNWYACLDVFSKDDKQRHEKAASLLVHYGWASDYREKYPVSENIFYTVEAINGIRIYNIIDDDITLRFNAIERESQSTETRAIIADNRADYEDRINSLQSIFQPLFWKRDSVRIGLKTEEREQCNARISEYIDELLSHNAFDNITLEEHIERTTVDKSDTGIIWAEPRTFIFSLDDIEFTDYKYNITSENSREYAVKSGAVRSLKAAERNFTKVIGNIGDILTTKQLKAMGIDKDKIPRLIRNKKIERIERGCYRIISS